MFRLSLLAAIFSLLFCIQSFGRCESFDGNLQHVEHESSSNTINKDESTFRNEEEESDSDPDSTSEDKPEDLYFYLFDGESVVTEYEAPPDKEAKEEPDFLYHPQPGHIRIVEFYAHWCPHCAHFRPKYNAFAKRMKEIAERSKLELDIYAVSCVPHRELCRDQDIHGYPKIRLFLGDNGTEEEGIEIAITDLHPFLVLQKIDEKTGTEASAAFATIGENEEQYSHNEKNELSASRLDNDSFWIHRTKYDIYSDAYLSFHFAMEHGIFVGRDLPNKEAKKAFNDWIDLLNQVLPPSWPLQAMLSDIAHNIETVLDSEANLLEIVDRYPPPRKNWSQSCSRSDSTIGYTCGLWQLFHIVTLGVVEWNLNNVAGSHEYEFYTPRQVGQIFRTYIDNFFGCEVCRINFLHDYDNCGFHRCERLTTEYGSLKDWKELPLWLFEVHNGVNSRLMKERAERDNRAPTQQELTAVEWPARKYCPLCWHADGRFDPDAVYSFLQLTYWPDKMFSSNERRDLVAATGSTAEFHRNKDEEGIESWVYSLVGLVLASFLFTIASWRAQKHREIERTGKHKKADDDNFV